MKTFYKKLFCEFFGTLVLLMAVTGSGIMGNQLASGNLAVALLANSIATGAVLFVLISLLAPAGSAQFNPVVSVVAFFNRDISLNELLLIILAQCVGGVCAVWLTHLMFDLPMLQVSNHTRASNGLLISELLATLLLLTVIELAKQNIEKIATCVALIVTAGYWFTSSTFFCNPAATLARSLTDTFVGIRPMDIPGFIAMQVLACVLFIIAKKFLKKS